MPACARSREAGSARLAGLFQDPRRHGAHEEGEEEFYAFGLPDLDLLPFLTEAFVTEMPYTVLCEEGCKGLCPVCGADRNVEDCGHEPEAFHPFLGLKDLLPEL